MSIKALRRSRHISWACSMIAHACCVVMIFFVGSVLNAQTKTAIIPNIIFINCDDLGYGDMGCYGAEDIRTLHIDRMAIEGMRFTDFSVTAALCTPSRASLMTGKYPGRVGLATGGLRPDAKNGLASDEITLAEVAKANGYRTGCIGKWHLGFVRGMRPMDQGFDHYDGVLHNLDQWETVVFEKESFRENRWKLHLSKPPELYDLATDISESHDLAEQNPEIVARLAKSAQRIREETNALHPPSVNR
jgi:arylsulfatase A-like enzyme